jgi:hypothetical protein
MVCFASLLFVIAGIAALISLAISIKSARAAIARMNEESE